MFWNSVTSVHLRAIVTGREKQLFPRVYFKIKQNRGYQACSWRHIRAEPGPELQARPGDVIVPVTEQGCHRIKWIWVCRSAAKVTLVT